MGKAYVCGTFPKCGTGLGYFLILGPLFRECSQTQDLPYAKHSERLWENELL